MAQPIWSTAAGTLGSFPSFIYLEVQLVASPVPPAVSMTYRLISGLLPDGLSMSIDGLGLIYGTPSLVTAVSTHTFVIRATDDLGNLRDRTFSITINGSAIPQITTPSGTLLSQYDSTWTQVQIEYSNPAPNNAVVIQLKDGMLPPGLEIDEQGLISGYPLPPTNSIAMPKVTTVATATTASTNAITCFSTNDFFEGRPVNFTGTAFSTIVAGTTYYVKNILSPTTFTISTTQYGSTFSLIDATGFLDVTLPLTTVGEPNIRTYSFTLKLTSELGGNFVEYNMVIINQRAAPPGPNKGPNSRIPTILNTRPLTNTISGDDPYYGYYLLPPVPTTTYANIGTIESGEYFSFKIIGYDFDDSSLTYTFSELPTGLYGDPVTGWITGVPILASPGLNQYTFKVWVSKTSSPSVYSDSFGFKYALSYDVVGVVTWITDSNIGSLFNGAVCTLNVEATSDVTLSYHITSGSLPPNMSLASNGDILGRVPFQPTDSLKVSGQTTEFSFVVEAYSLEYPAVTSSKTFTLTVVQKYDQPTDIVYCKAAPSIPDRLILGSLLSNQLLIPDEYLYRPDDIYFGKATSVIYPHMYGVYAANLEKYIEAVTISHYWRNIVLGEVKTAVARNDAGEIIYEVVYGTLIDDIKSDESSETTTGFDDEDPPWVIWDTPINLNMGPWYTSATDIFTSYALILGQEYYTSLTPGFTQIVYPNSLLNMRNRVADVVGQSYDSNLLPLWMTSQQRNGGTLGYTLAWVICYTKPNPGGTSYAETIKNNIQTLWPYTLNQINFKLDRLTVDKSQTYNYDPNTHVWAALPSAVPAPDPLDSADFYVLFPRQTILPNTLG